MPERTIATLARMAVLTALCLAAAQIPLTAQTTGNENDAWLTQTVRLYYFSAKAGLKGFDCAVRPDWHAFYSSAGSMSAENEQRAALLSRVGIMLHARMKGGSTMDWNPPAESLSADQTSVLSQMHDALNQTIVDGFLQFWTPFIENTVIPDSSSGMEMSTTSAGGRKVHLKQTDIELDETFDSDRILRQYNIVMSSARIKLTPTYAPSAQVLIISHFHATIQPTGSENVQEMNVDVQYQTIGGYPLPTHVVMEVTGVATLHFALEGCTVQ